MESTSLEQLHADMQEMKEELRQLSMLVREEYALADGVVAEISASRERPQADLIAHDAMRREFG